MQVRTAAIPVVLSACLTLLGCAKNDSAGSSAPEAAGILTSLAKASEPRPTQRAVRANELLAQAKEDFRTETIFNP